MPAGLQPQQLEQALQALALAHPALAAFTRDERLVLNAPRPAGFSRWVQSAAIAGTVESCAEAAFADAVGRLDPPNGVMMQATLLRQHQQTLGLVLVIHHLVVDGVSWRVLLDELRQAAEAIMAGQSPQLPAEETSLADWSAALKQNTPQRHAELPFWQSMLQHPVPRLGQRALTHRDRHGEMNEKRCLLNPGQTRALLTTLPPQYRASTEEMLLTALSLALAGRFSARELRYTLESHGRAELSGDRDLARTVGWLTAEYPLRIALQESGTNTLRDAVRAVKSVMRAVNDRGTGFGQLCWLSEAHGPQLQKLAQQHAPEVLFNYLGRFSSGSAQWTPQRTRQRFRDAFAVWQDPQMPQLHALEVNIFVDEQSAEPQLAIHWGWLRDVFSEEDIDALHVAVADAADALADFARRSPQRAADTLVAAEVALPGIAQTDVQVLATRHGPLAAILPLLPLQKGLLFHAQTAGDSGSYNSLTRLTFRGPLDEARLRTALNAVVTQHPQLAARFDSELALQPLQLIPVTAPQTCCWPLDSLHLPTMTPEEEETALRALEQDELARDLFSQPAMLHAVLVRHGDTQRATLLLNAHHLVVDGWSTPVFVSDLLTALHHGAQALTPHRASYAGIVRQLAARDTAASRRIWQSVLQDVRPTLLFGTDVRPGAVRERHLLLDPVLEQGLLALCRQRGLTLNSVMQGIWGMLLAVESGHQDVVFGSPVSGRFGQIEGQQQHVGLFSNTLPVRMRFDARRPLLAQLAEHQAQQIQLIEHDDLGLGELQQLAGCGTLFDTLLVVENYPDNRQLHQPHNGLSCEAIANRGYTHYPLTLLVLPGERLQLLMEYRDAVTHPQRLADRLLMLIEQLVAAPDRPLARWTLQTPDEQARLAEVNDTDHPLAADTLQQAVERQVARTPDALALRDADHHLTYRQMHIQARLLADRLIAAGVRPGDVVAVALPRSVRLSLALTAIVQVGAAWLPLDTGYPDDRLALMVEDARPALIVTESALLSRFALPGTLLTFDRLADEAEPQHPLPAACPDRPAYVLYTSGSTGRPKGVVVGHRAIVNRLAWMQAAYPLAADDVVMQKTPCSFDVSVWEFFWPLMTGAQLLMAPPDAHRDPDALTRLINEYRVTTLHFVPSMLAAWIATLDSGADAPHCRTLRRVFCSGEALSCDLAEDYQSRVAAPLHNLYGPTEAAVDVTWYPASGDALAACQGAGVPVGYPVWNTRLRILDTLLRPVPLGVAGDLYLTGVQLADGYLRRPDLTAQRFVADPFAAGERMYRTGDIVRWLDNGAVEYLGRSDDQLKIRGQRIELGEIEQALLALPGVAQAVVAARELGDPTADRVSDGADARQLVAWLIAEPGVPLENERLHQQLAARLPAHMLPVSYVLTDRFPLSANGKLDRKALPLPQAPRSGGRLPESDNERLLAALFARLLGRETIHADDDFFALGGHSLLAMRLAAELKRCTRSPLSIGQIMAARSVEKMAQLLDDCSADSAESRANGECLPLRSGTGPTLFCIHPASGFAWQYAGMMRYLNGDFPIVGLQSPRPDGVIARCNSIDEMCERHLATLRSVQPQGPYFLLGYSLGGTLAHGMAARLQQQGETVAFLGLLDTYPPEGQDWTPPSEADAREEIAREETEFMAANADDSDPLLQAEKAAMFRHIVANYQDAVLRLSAATSKRFDGQASLFVASKTLPEAMDVAQCWAPYLQSLDIHRLPCKHMDILSPASLVELGPLLNRIIAEKRSEE
ncbi:amino acid adenylation domain-containing protein [Erwiniaceae bacterium CAU 1747]